jgi:hypothetical protein
MNAPNASISSDEPRARAAARDVEQSTRCPSWSRSARLRSAIMGHRRLLPEPVHEPADRTDRELQPKRHDHGLELKSDG